jgi:hypothetical protein
MKISKLWEQYHYYTQDVTEHGRKLGFAGAAICWFFRGDVGVRFPPLVYWALFFFICYFVADLMQSLIGAHRTKTFTESEEKALWDASGKLCGDDEVKKPRSVDVPMQVAFWVKIAFLLIGFGFLGAFVFIRASA